MRLRIIRTTGTGPERERIIGRETLVIGRGDDCDWVLPDPERTLSKRHFELAFQGAVFVLRDTSTNGVFLNASAEPVGRGKSVVLKHGDSFRAAGFGFRVEVLASDPAAQPFDTPKPAATAPARAPFVDPGSAIDAGNFQAGTSADPFDAFGLPAAAHDPLGDAGAFSDDWGVDTTQAGFSGGGFGAFDAPAPQGPRGAAIPDDLDLIPLGLPASDDPWSTPSDQDMRGSFPPSLPDLAAQMIETLVQLDRQNQAVARRVGLAGSLVCATDSLPTGTGQTMVAHLTDMPDGQGRVALEQILQAMVARGEAILRQLEAQPQTPAPSANFEDDPFE